MLETHLRYSYQKILVDPVANYCQTLLWLKPNHITFLATLLGLLVPMVIVFSTPIAIILMWLSGYCDTLDGTLARLREETSATGSALDIISDRIVEFACCFALLLLAPSQALELMLLLGSILICVTVFLVIGIFVNQQSNKSFFYHPGLIERAETFIFFTLMMIWPQWMSVLAIIASTLILLTALLHFRAFHFYTNSPK